jgi:hypothetical protein
MIIEYIKYKERIFIYLRLFFLMKNILNFRFNLFINYLNLISTGYSKNDDSPIPSFLNSALIINLKIYILFFINSLL